MQLPIALSLRYLRLARLKLKIKPNLPLDLRNLDLIFYSVYFALARRIFLYIMNFANYFQHQRRLSFEICNLQLIT